MEGRLSDAQAEELTRLDHDLIKLAILATVQRIAEQNARIAKLEGRVAVAGAGDPSTPSGQRAIYTKPPAPQRKGKPGAKPGISRDGDKSGRLPFIEVLHHSPP